ncbi:MAG TPA: polyprenyl synthetase family protein [Acidimicrobiales bacterium]|nr:polyprenyl synthetase family protein [Acidimicrobiales bacterium]
MNVSRLLDLPRLQDDLSLLEHELGRAVSAEDAFLTQVARHLVDAGGKRLRPALALASASVGRAPEGPASTEVLLGGVAVELVHVGSLCHDDVIDEAVTRRGVETVNARWGNLVAILAGDFLLARASEIAAGLGTEVAGLLAATIARLCQGQTVEIQAVFDVDRSESSYLSAISGKTASLMAAACRIGGLTAGHGRDELEALTAFGTAFGMAFQICDDVLDLVGTDESLGKPAGLDLTAGVYTLPVIRALADPDSGPELRPILGCPLAPPERDKARQIVRSSPGVAAAVETARTYADQAVEATRPFGDGVGTALGRLGHHLIDSLPLG